MLEAIPKQSQRESYTVPLLTFLCKRARPNPHFCRSRVILQPPSYQARRSEARRRLALPFACFTGIRNQNHTFVVTFLVVYSCGMVWFEWDQAKATSNERKHGVRFDDAMLVFADPFALVEQDRIEGGELRWQTLGLVGEVVLLLVAHTVRGEDEDEIIRIISARKASRGERKRYDENREKDSLR